MSVTPTHRCTTEGCPYLGQPSPSHSCRCHKTSEQLLMEQRDELLVRCKAMLQHIVYDPEGDLTRSEFETMTNGATDLLASVERRP